jgi:hypothetical protein
MLLALLAAAVLLSVYGIAIGALSHRADELEGMKVAAWVLVGAIACFIWLLIELVIAGRRPGNEEPGSGDPEKLR